MQRVLLIILPLFVLAQNYVLKKDVLSSGGRKMTSTDYILQGTISQTAIGRVTDTDYKGVIGFWHPPEAFPPVAPYINPAEKSGNDVKLTWNMVTTDTLGNAETVHYYVVYRSTTPSFIPGISDSVGATIQPDTVFTDIGALNSSSSYYYLVKAVDIARNRSVKSNMGYKLAKSFNENAGATSDRNWTSIPWHSNFSTVSDLTTELSPSGVPLLEINNLRDDQFYENYTYIFPIGWLGTNFSVDQGKAYEMITDRDTVLMIVGANNPSGLVVLNENAGATSDRNWVSIPYNAVYNHASDITTEYSPSGDPLIEINNIRDDQFYENYTYIFPIGWLGTDFAITPGRGYEFIMTTDTTWNPTEYTNRSGDYIFSKSIKRSKQIAVHLGELTKSKRNPVWIIKEMADCVIKDDYKNSSRYTKLTTRIKEPTDYHNAGISHLVVARFNSSEFDNVVFTAYRLNDPEDVLTENIVGCGVAKKDDNGVLWFNTGNFRTPWQNNEVVVLIAEAVKANRGYFSAIKFTLDNGFDIQDIGDLSFMLIPEARKNKKSDTKSWSSVKNDNVIGYSIYKMEQHLNDAIVTKQEYAVEGEVKIHPVIIGGYETVYSSYQEDTDELINLCPITYSIDISPNPFSTRATISYALPHNTLVSIRIYDISGRLVKDLMSEKLDAGFYTSYWNGYDDMNRKVAAGVYFISMKTEDHSAHRKIILIN